MAAGAFTLYNSAKKHIGDGSIDLDTNNFQMALYTAASNCVDPTLEFFSAVTGELLQANGYTSSGKALTNVTWAPVGGSPDMMKFSSAAVSWLVSGGDISGIKYAVVQQVNGGLLLCYATLSDISTITVTNGNTLTVTPSSSGYFELR